MRGPCTPAYLTWRLDLDAGQLSRTLKNLEAMGQISLSTVVDDRRKRELSNFLEP